MLRIKSGRSCGSYPSHLVKPLGVFGGRPKGRQRRGRGSYGQERTCQSRDATGQPQQAPLRLAAPLYLGTYLGESLTGSARSRNARRDRPRTPQVGKLGRGCGETPDHKPTPEPRHRTVLNTTGRGGRGLCFCCLLFFLLCSS